MAASRDDVPPSYVRIHASDDVVIALRPLVAGEELTIEGRSLRILADVPLGSKVALRNLPAGSAVKKWGESIGRTTQSIEAGAHVHVHNLESEFLATRERGHGIH